MVTLRFYQLPNYADKNDRSTIHIKYSVGFGVVKPVWCRTKIGNERYFCSDGNVRRAIWKVVHRGDVFLNFWFSRRSNRRVRKCQFFVATCYKVMATIATGQSKSKIITAILNIGADPILIREDNMLTPWLELLNPIQANIRAASDTTFTAEGVIRQQVEIGGHVTAKVFSVDRN